MEYKYSNREKYDGWYWDFFTIKYLGPPIVSSVAPSSGEPGETLDITITGSNFYPGASVSFSGSGITVSSVSFRSSTELKANITVSEGATPGKRDITVTNIDEATGIKSNGFEIKGEDDRGMEEIEVIEGVNIQLEIGKSK